MATLLEQIAKIQTLIDDLEALAFGDDTTSVTHEGTTRDSLSKAIKGKFDAIQAMVQGRKSFETLTELNAFTPTADADGYYPLAEVWNDPTLENNGFYGWSAGAWTVSAYSSTLKTLNQLSILSAATTKTVDDSGLSADLTGVLADVMGVFPPELEHVFSLADDSGFSPFTIDENGNVNVSKLIASLMKFDSVEIESGSYNYDVSIVDENDNALIGLLNGEILRESTPEVPPEPASQQYVPQYPLVGHFSRHNYDLNHIVVYGQSLSNGMEGWPALSKNQSRGCLMLGDCVRPVSPRDPGFVPFGGAELKPLIANVQSEGTLLTDEEVRALPAGNGALGETVNFGMANGAARAYQRIHRDTSAIVTTNCGVAGKTIEQLSKINTQDSTDRYSRFLGAINGVQAIADSNGLLHGVTALVWMQGEWNYADHGGSRSKSEYKTLFKQLIDDMTSDCQAVTGQEDPPVFITYQTGDSYTRETDSTGYSGLFIGEAQFEVAEENNGVFMAGPIYPYTDKGGHMDSNGYRWFGNLLAKVYEHVVIRGLEWKPLHPLKATVSGNAVTIDFHVPHPPLEFDVAYDANVQDMYEHKGFRLTGGSSQVEILSVEIVSPTAVRITASEELDDSITVWYAGQTSYFGCGNLRDSDPAVANDKYEFIPDSGMYDSANIPDLVDKPYSLQNWCVAFTIQPEAI